MGQIPKYKQSGKTAQFKFTKSVKNTIKNFYEL